MPRSNRPRKAYRPRRQFDDPIEEAIARAGTAPRRTVASLISPMRAALDQLRTGKGSQASWDGLADAMNVAAALMDLSIAPDHREKVVSAFEALRGVKSRVLQGGGWTLCGLELSALVDACEIHEIQLELASQREIQAAITRTRRMAAGVLAGKAPPNTETPCIGALGRYQE